MWRVLHFYWRLLNRTWTDSVPIWFLLWSAYSFLLSAQRAPSPHRKRRRLSRFQVGHLGVQEKSLHPCRLIGCFQQSFFTLTGEDFSDKLPPQIENPSTLWWLRSIRNHGGIISREISSHRNQNCPYTVQNCPVPCVYISFSVCYSNSNRKEPTKKSSISDMRMISSLAWTAVKPIASGSKPSWSSLSAKSWKWNWARKRHSSHTAVGMRDF